jgi:hypothetical protein
MQKVSVLQVCVVVTQTQLLLFRDGAVAKRMHVTEQEEAQATNLFSLYSSWCWILDLHC